jgi:hypothetical protein
MGGLRSVGGVSRSKALLAIGDEKRLSMDLGGGPNQEMSRHEVVILPRRVVITHGTNQPGKIRSGGVLCAEETVVMLHHIHCAFLQGGEIWWLAKVVLDGERRLQLRTISKDQCK